MSIRRRKITKAELEQIAALAKMLDFRVEAIELTSSCVRLGSASGHALTAGDDQEILDKELAEHRAEYGPL
jgi:hypothetical protein